MHFILEDILSCGFIFAMDWSWDDPKFVLWLFRNYTAVEMIFCVSCVYVYVWNNMILLQMVGWSDA